MVSAKKLPKNDFRSPKMRFHEDEISVNRKPWGQRSYRREGLSVVIGIVRIVEAAWLLILDKRDNADQ
jgi:hypothetical protein